MTIQREPPLLVRARRAAILSCRERAQLLREMIATMESLREALEELRPWADALASVNMFPISPVHRCDTVLAEYKGEPPPPPLPAAPPQPPPKGKKKGRRK